MSSQLLLHLSSGKIMTSECFFEIHPKCMDIFLKKQSTNRWKTLSPSRRHLDTVQTAKSEQKLTNQLSGTAAEAKEDLAGSNWNDLNDDSSHSNESPSFTANNLLMETGTESPDLNNVIGTMAAGKATPTDGISTSVVATPPTAGMVFYSQPSSSSSGYSSNASDSSENEKRGGRDNQTIPQEQTTMNNLSLDDRVLSSDEATPTPTPAELDDLDWLAWEDRNSKPSLSGLVNFGNTCFMNTVVQCLSNTAPLRSFFTNGRFLADINKANSLGYNGELATSFSETVTHLWSGKFELYSLHKLKAIISSRAGYFEGYQQQDAHEFMSYLLDGLHEDLNRVHDKPSTSDMLSDGLADSVVAERAWQVHQKRNDSYFVDNFQGQFKSTLVCPVCQNVSFKFHAL